MAEYSFYTNPMSRGQIARWALHEAGADYEQVLVDYGPDQPEAFVKANPMRKFPTLVHHHMSENGGTHDHVVTEAAAICHYLAEMLGFGSYDRLVDTLEQMLTGRDYVCGDRFTMADVYVGSHAIWGIDFDTLPKRDAFIAYGERLKKRPASIEARKIDADLSVKSASAPG